MTLHYHKYVTVCLMYDFLHSCEEAYSADSKV
jgi:hypothetical protein